MEMEIGNGNIKVAGLLAALIDLRVVAGLLLLACCSYASGALPASSLASLVRCGNE